MSNTKIPTQMFKRHPVADETHHSSGEKNKKIIIILKKKMLLLLSFCETACWPCLVLGGAGPGRLLGLDLIYIINQGRKSSGRKVATGTFDYLIHSCVYINNILKYPQTV